MEVGEFVVIEMKIKNKQDMEVGEFVVRPSSQGLDKLTLTRKVCLPFSLTPSSLPLHHLMHEFARHHTQRVGRSLSLALARSLSRARSLCRLLSLSLCM